MLLEKPGTKIKWRRCIKHHPLICAIIILSSIRPPTATQDRLLFHNPKLIRYQLFSSPKGAVLPPNPLFRPSTVTISGRVRVVAENRLSPSLPLARSTGKLHQYSTRKQPYYSTRSDYTDAHNKAHQNKSTEPGATHA